MPRDLSLVSFLGRYEHYSRTAYAFADGDVIEASFFGWAAWQHLRTQPRGPQRWVILGTATSSWECLIDLFGDDFPEGLEDWANRVESERRNTGTSDARLAEFARFSAALAIPEIVLRIMPVDDLDGTFAVLYETLSPTADVILDVTHAPRAMPLNTLLALGGLRWMRDIQLNDVLYGSVVRTGGEPTPMRPSPFTGWNKRDNTPWDVVSLLSAADLAARGPSLARIALTDDFEAAAEVGRGLGAVSQKEDQLLLQQGIYQSLLCRKQAAENAKRLRKLFDDAAVDGAGGGLRAALRNWIREKLKGVSPEKGGSNIAWMVADARKSLGRRDYLRCLFQLNEAVRLGLADQLGGEPTAKFSDLMKQLEAHKPTADVVDRFRVLMQLRNRAAHGTSGGTSKLLRPYLHDPATIRQLFAAVLVDLDRVLGGTRFWNL